MNKKHKTQGDTVVTMRVRIGDYECEASGPRFFVEGAIARFVRRVKTKKVQV